MCLNLCLFSYNCLPKIKRSSWPWKKNSEKRTNLPSDCDTKLGQTNSCPIDHEELTAIEWDLDPLTPKPPTPFIIRTNRARPYASTFVHTQGIEKEESFIDPTVEQFSGHACISKCWPDHGCCCGSASLSSSGQTTWAVMWSMSTPQKDHLNVKSRWVLKLLAAFLWTTFLPPQRFDPLGCCFYLPLRRRAPLLLPPKTDSVHTWSDTKAKWPAASVERCWALPTSPATWRLTARPTSTPVTKVLRA